MRHMDNELENVDFLCISIMIVISDAICYTFLINFIGVYDCIKNIKSRNYFQGIGKSQ